MPGTLLQECPRGKSRGRRSKIMRKYRVTYYERQFKRSCSFLLLFCSRTVQVPFIVTHSVFNKIKIVTHSVFNKIRKKTLLALGQDKWQWSNRRRPQLSKGWQTRLPINRVQVGKTGEVLRHFGATFQIKNIKHLFTLKKCFFIYSYSTQTEAVMKFIMFTGVTGCAPCEKCLNAGLDSIR